MAQRLKNSFVNTNIPGAYPNVTVRSNPTGTGLTGVVVIMGEASSGPASDVIDSTDGEALKDTFYSPDQIGQVVDRYESGPIVDAFRALASPSADANIVGSVTRVYILKTNAGTKADASMASNYGTMTARLEGKSGNKYAYQIKEYTAEAGPSHTGSDISGSLPASGDDFSVRVDGVSTVISLASAPADVDAIVTDINVELNPIGLEAENVNGSLKIKSSTDSDAPTSGNGKAFELIAGSDIANFGLTAGLYVSTQEPVVTLEITRADTNTNESFRISSENVFYVASNTAADNITISDTQVTLVVGATSHVLDLDDYNTIQALVTKINSLSDVVAYVDAASANLPPSVLDNVSGISIGVDSSVLDCSVAGYSPVYSDMGKFACRIKRAAYNFSVAAGQSAVLEFESGSAGYVGLPAVMAAAEFLDGGLRGATAADKLDDAVEEMDSVDANFIIPLFSRDASLDIIDGITDSNSDYEIDAINALVRSHVIAMSTPKIKKHRQAFLSFCGDYSDVQQKVSQISHYRVAFNFQKPSQVNTFGVVTEYQPWYLSCIAAGMQAAGYYKSVTNKFANIISFKDPDGFDSGSPGDIEEALDLGLMFLERSVGGSKWVSDQTSYAYDTNFVYNQVQAVYAADLVTLDLAASFKKAFVGRSLADVNASIALAFLAAKMDGYRAQKLIAASDDAALGYKNAKIKIVAPTMEVCVEIKLATAIYFIPISIEISQVQSSASQ